MFVLACFCACVFDQNLIYDFFLFCTEEFIFCFSWVKKNVKETYGGDEEVNILFLTFVPNNLSHFMICCTILRYQLFSSRKK